MDLLKITESVQAFAAEAHAIFGRHEAARSSRVVALSHSYDRLTKLSINQDELIRQALRSIEAGLYRSAHVMAWAGFMDFYEERLDVDGLKALSNARPKWNTRSIDELREHVTEYQLIEAGREIHILLKNDVKALHGLLNKRNECAHPSAFHPDVNEALGYISEILQRIDKLRGAVPHHP